MIDYRNDLQICTKVFLAENVFRLLVQSFVKCARVNNKQILRRTVQMYAMKELIQNKKATNDTNKHE
jgi:hypothetical protein